MPGAVGGLSESAVIPLEVQHQVLVDWLVLGAVGMDSQNLLPFLLKCNIPQVLVDWLVLGTVHGLSESAAIPLEV